MRAPARAAGPGTGGDDQPAGAVGLLSVSTMTVSCSTRHARTASRACTSAPGLCAACTWATMQRSGSRKPASGWYTPTSVPADDSRGSAAAAPSHRAARAADDARRSAAILRRLAVARSGVDAAGDEQQALARALLQLAPQLIRAPQQRHIPRIFRIREADDPAHPCDDPSSCGMSNRSSPRTFSPRRAR